MTEPNHYETLGVPRDADEKTIKKAYRRLVIEVHPDKNPDDEHAAQRFRVVKAAHEALSDPQRRKAHDSELAARSRAKAREQERARAHARERERVQEEARARKAARQARREARRPSAGASRSSAEEPPKPRPSSPVKRREGSSVPWGKVAFGLAGAAVIIGGATYAAKRWAPVDPSAGRHRDRKTGRFRKGYIR